MSDFFIVCVCAILGLAAHGATRKRWLEWVLRIIIAIFFVGEGLYAAGANLIEDIASPWNRGILYSVTAFSGLDLVKLFRVGVSAVLTVVEYLIGGQWLISLIRRQPLKPMAEKVFVVESIPHMVALFIYVQTMGYLLGAINPQEMGMPNIPMPLPLPLLDLLGQLFSYNGLGMVILSFCGVGVYVSRKPRECMTRLGWVKPTGPQIGIGLLIILGSFFYDYLWSLYAGNLHQDLGNKLALYNSGTFAIVGGFHASVILALATAIFAGVGEETLTRGALQPALGIVPAGLIHGALHGQFAHAPIFILQVAGWSCLMGIVRKYTNTTTTIIGHAGYNFVTTFLFSFNP